MKKDKMSHLRKLIFSSLFTVLIIVGSYISIPFPFTPIPFTLQVLFILLSGIILGPYYGFMSSLLYLILGIIGLPVFSGGQGGLVAIVGPTGGYLVGFLVAPIIIGYFSKKSRKLMPVGIILGILIIHLLGVLWLARVNMLSISKAFIIGSLPFIPFDLVKGAIAYTLSLYLVKHIRVKFLT